MKILAFAATNSSKSINKQLISFASSQLTNGLASGADVEIIDLNDFEMPIYSSDREESDGIPELAKTFRAKIANADAVLISFAEHNGSYTAAYKNIFDWASRLEGKVYEGKSAILLSTSPGARGGASVLEAATASMPFFGANVLGSLAVPSFYDQFDAASSTLKEGPLLTEFNELLSRFSLND